MCGIVGIISKLNSGITYQQKQTFEQLLYVGALRGDDSTGIIGIEDNGTFHIAKDASNATWFLHSYDKMKSDMLKYGQGYIGHNRKSTIGKTNDDNAHPFVINNEFALVHNGTLNNHKKLANTEVDSEALAIVLHRALGEEDYLSALSNELSSVIGAYAVAIYDQRSNKVHLLRNKERPLCYIDTGKSLCFTSEGLMLSWVLSRNGSQKEEIVYKFLPEDTLLTLDLNTCEVKLEAIPAKKYLYTPTIVAPPTNTNGSSIKYSGEGMSKQAFKRFRRRLLGKELHFYASDYVEKDPNKKLVEGPTEVILLGDSEYITQEHYIKGEIDTAKFPSLDFLGICDILWKGVVEAMEYEKDTNTILIDVYNITATEVVKSKELEYAH